MRLIFAIAVGAALALPSLALGNDLPDRRVTPGHTDPSLTKAKLCAKGFTTKTIRNVSAETHAQVFRLYHVTDCGREADKPSCGKLYEVDHLVSLELGGSNDVTNLWPQSYGTRPWNARVKDRLENQLHRLVCTGKLGLREAQQSIAVDWIAAYKEHCPTTADCPPYRPKKK